MANKEEGNSEMAVGKLNRGYVNLCGRSKRKSSSLTNIESLPDELVFDILLRLPAEDIYNGARLVCKKWYKIINNRNFINTHLHHSTPHLVIQIISSSGRPNFAIVQQGRFKTFDFKYEFLGLGNSCSCNGLILGYATNDALYITNPATKKHLVLPRGGSYSSAIAYAPASMQYKVVRLDICMDTTPNVPVVRGIAILTAGVDNSWRHLGVEKLPYTPRFRTTVTPLTTEGFIHWTCSEWNYVLTLNVETETITDTPIPDVCGGGRSNTFLSTGTTLTLLVSCTEFSWEVWELKQENVEWRKVIKIDLEPQKDKIEHLIDQKTRYDFTPAGWVNYKDVLVLRVSSYASLFFRYGAFLLYNIHTQEIIDFLAIDRMGVGSFLFLYRSSVVWLD